MSKNRYVYNLLGASELKSRADVPLAANITVVDDTVDYIACVNIDMDLVKTILGVAIDTELYALCRHDNVNRWSAFCPVARSFSGSGFTTDLVNDLPSEGSLEEFAGYNHSALTPGWQTGGQASAEADIWINSGSKATVSAPICIGEIDWGALGAEWVVMLIFDEADAIVGWGLIDVASVSGNFTLEGESDDTLILDKSWYGRLLICSDPDLDDHDDVESAVVCRIPNTSTFDINIKIKEPSSLTLDGTAWNETTSQTVGNVSFSGISFNPSTGQVSLGDAKDTTVGLDGLRIRVQVFNWLDEEVAAGDIYNYTIAGGGPVDPYGTYVSDNWIVSDGGWVDPLPTYDAGSADYSYGYRFVLTVLEHS